MITIIIKIICRIFRFCLIQPEYFDSFLIIILFCFAPDVFSCRRICGIKVNRSSLEIQPHAESSFCTDKIPFFQHFPIVLTGFIYCRPDRHHQFNPHFLQFPNHGIRIRPIYRVKFPLPLLRPVEEINDDQINGKVPSLIFLRHLQQLFLCLITEFALPETKPIFRHHRNFSGYCRICFLNFRRCISSHYPII